MTRPNTFIVGAPKCGTTALCHYLASHPNIFMCDPKEPHYFAHKDMPDRKHYYRKLDEYLALFSNAAPNQSIVAEGSVWYLFCENALENIKRFSPDAKVIVMLRRPDEMVHSYHNQALVSFNEDITDFQMAWEISTKPNSPRPIPTHCDEAKVLQYGEIASYGTQLEHLYSVFPEEQVLVVLFEDLTSDAHTFYRAVLKFLELPEIYPLSFEKVNENKVYRNKTLGRFLTHPPKSITSTLNLLKKVFGIKKLNLRKRLLDNISTRQKRAPLNPQLKAEIIDHYRNEILKAQNLINRNLSHWFS